MEAAERQEAGEVQPLSAPQEDSPPSQSSPANTRRSAKAVRYRTPQSRIAASAARDPRLWRKITYGLRTGPVDVRSERRLPAAKRPRGASPLLEQVRAAEDARLRAALALDEQPLTKGKGLAPLPDASAASAALRRAHRSEAERALRERQRAALLAARAGQRRAAPRPRKLPPLHGRPAASESPPAAGPPPEGGAAPDSAQRGSRAVSVASPSTASAPSPRRVSMAPTGDPRRASEGAASPASPGRRQSAARRRSSAVIEEPPPLEVLLQQTDAATVRRVKRQLAHETATGSAHASPRQQWAEAAEEAAAARIADAKCPDPAAVLAVRAAILAQTAYRVPTGHDFWERIRAVRDGKSRAAPTEILKRYRREADASLANVHDFLLRLYKATGLRLRLCAHTRLDLGAFDAPAADARVPLIALLGQEPRHRRGVAALLQSAQPQAAEQVKEMELPEVPPGWLVAKDEDDPSAIYVSVAGTQNVNDVFRDCMFVPAPMWVPDGLGVPPEWGPLELHTGFLDGAKRIWPRLIAELRKLGKARPQIEVHFTGHSLGGATAILLACFLRCLDPSEGITVASLHTFGAPNVFVLRDWPRDLELLPRSAEQHQYVNSRDLVPRALGSAIIQSLAKIAIRLGFRALACITQENADSLPLYRFVGVMLHFIDADGEVHAIDQRPAQEKILELSATDLRPQAGLDHKVGNYITQLIARLDRLTGHTHAYSQEVTELGASTVGCHPVAQAVFDEDMQVTKDFISAAEHIFKRFRSGDEGGLDAAALATLFQWTGKVWPEYLIQDHLLSGRYDATDGEMTKEGWLAFVEDQAYVDQPWIARLLEQTGWRHEKKSLQFKAGGHGRRRREDVRPTNILVTPRLLNESRQMSSGAAAAVDALYRAYSRGLPLDLFPPEEGARRKHFFRPETERIVVRPEALQLLMANAQHTEFGNFAASEDMWFGSGEKTAAAELATSSGKEVSVARIAAATGVWLEEAAAVEGGTDVFGNVTLVGWRAIWKTICDDEVRGFQLLARGAGWDPVTGRLRNGPADKQRGRRDGPLWRTEELDSILRRADELHRKERARQAAQQEALFRERLWQAIRGVPRRPPQLQQPAPSGQGGAVSPRSPRRVLSPRVRAYLAMGDGSPRTRGAAADFPASEPPSAAASPRTGDSDPEDVLTPETRRLLRLAMRKEKRRLRERALKREDLAVVYLAKQPGEDALVSLKPLPQLYRDYSPPTGPKASPRFAQRLTERAGYYQQGTMRHHQWVFPVLGREFDEVQSTNDAAAPFDHATARERRPGRAHSPSQARRRSSAAPGFVAVATGEAPAKGGAQAEAPKPMTLQVWFHNARKDHLCTATQLGGKAARTAGYTCCGPIGQVYAAPPEENALPLQLFYHPCGDHAFAATEQSCAQLEQRGYAPRGVLGYIHAAAPAGVECVPLERWYCADILDSIAVAGEAMHRMLRAEALRGLRYVRQAVEGFIPLV